jgi:hypothetical protein
MDILTRPPHLAYNPIFSPCPCSSRKQLDRIEAVLYLTQIIAHLCGLGCDTRFLGVAIPMFATLILVSICLP